MSPHHAPKDTPPAAAAEAAEALAALRRNEVRAEPVPEPGDPRWGVSAILRPKPSSPAVERASAAAERIAAPAGGHHVVYGPEALHVTVRSIEGFRALVPGDEAIKRYVDVLEREVRSLSALRLRFVGVTPTRSGVFAPSPDGSERLRGLRARLHEELAAAAPVPGREARRAREQTHMSLVLFNGPLADPAATATTLLALRDADLGAAEFDRVELVRYERGLESVTIVPLWGAPLRG